MVLPVPDIDPAIAVAGDVVDEVELAGGRSRLAPGEQQLAVGRVFCGRGRSGTRLRRRCRPAARVPEGLWYSSKPRERGELYG
jgi:hypothetical protein